MVLDGSANAVSSNAATTTAVLTTTQADDIIIAEVDIHCNHSDTTISGVTCDGNAMTLRSTVTVPSSLAACYLTHAVYWYHAASPLAAKNIVATYTNYTANTYQNLTAFGVTNCNLTTPFDTNGSLPAQSNSTPGGTRTTHNVTFSTTNPITFAFSTDAFDFNDIYGGVDTGDTLLYLTSAATYQGSLFEYRRFTTAQTSITKNIYADNTYAIGDIASIDALQHSSAPTEAADTSAMSGHLGHPGTFATTEDPDMFDGEGEGVITGALAASEAGDTAEFIGTVSYTARRRRIFISC
jgi:hypothetical protein